MSPHDAPIVDTHAHTWSGAFSEDHDEVMERAWGSGLTAVVEVGGTALVVEVELLTSKVRHFPMFADLASPT